MYRYYNYFVPSLSFIFLLFFTIYYHLKIRKELISKPTYRKQERNLIYDIMLLLARYLHDAGINCNNGFHYRCNEKLYMIFSTTYLSNNRGRTMKKANFIAMETIIPLTITYQKEQTLR